VTTDPGGGPPVPRDPNGAHPVRDLIAAAKRGGDFVSYRAGSLSGISPKLSYAAPFEPWQWAICTGIYVDDVDTRYDRVMVIVYAVIGSATVALAAAVVFLGAIRLIALRRA
jgi:methyl-accepting chemotaxis protein